MTTGVAIRSERIIITSDEPWGKVWHTQLHYAARLSDQHQVVYIAPPSAWKLSNLFSAGEPATVIHKSLKVLKYHNKLPSFLGRIALWYNDRYNGQKAAKALPPEANSSPTLVWHFDPFRGYFIGRKNKRIRHIYHVVDRYNHLALDPLLAKHSDLNVVTSPRQLDYYQNLNPNTICIPQGVSDEEFDTDEQLISQYRKEYGQFLLMTGSISSDNSMSLLNEIAETFPEHKLVIIGPEFLTEPEDITEFTKLVQHKNVCYLGVKHASELKNYAKAATVCIIPYKMSSEKKLNIRSPLKVINYLAQAKPVVTSLECEIPELNGKAITYVTTKEEFLEAIRNILSGKAQTDPASIRAYLNRINYRNLIEKILNQINGNNSSI